MVLPEGKQGGLLPGHQAWRCLLGAGEMERKEGWLHASVLETANPHDLK